MDGIDGKKCVARRGQFHWLDCAGKQVHFRKGKYCQRIQSNGYNDRRLAESTGRGERGACAYKEMNWAIVTLINNNKCAVMYSIYKHRVERPKCYSRSQRILNQNEHSKKILIAIAASVVTVSPLDVARCLCVCPMNACVPHFLPMHCEWMSRSRPHDNVCLYVWDMPVYGRA